jgi:hypothetical protein
MKYHMQPCWTCTKYCGGCNWTKKDPEPVEGWEAAPTLKYYRGYRLPSYAIHYCPEYEWDGTEVGRGG